VKRQFRRPAAAALALAVVSALQLARAEQAVEKGERIEVTGSRIAASSDLESTSPIAIIKAEDLRVEGFSSLELILNNYPQFTADQGNRSNNPSSGTATVNLRSLGPQRTLTLVNGRRLPAGDPKYLASDLNQIPPAMIQRIEILTGGASAVYGSDAIGGVVNFILNDHFEGVQGDLTYDFYNHQQKSWVANLLGPRNIPVPGDKDADGATTTATVTLGGNFNNDRGNAVVSLRYLKTETLLQSERDYSACALSRNAAGVILCQGSDAGYPGFFVDGSAPRLVVDGITQPRPQWTLNTPDGHVRPFVRPDDTFNFAPYNYYQRPAERYGANAFLNYQLTPEARVYAEFGYHDDHTNAQFAPTAIFFQRSIVPWENPQLTDDWRSRLTFRKPNGQLGTGPGTFADVQISRRNVEGGPRQDDRRHTSFREVIGVKGSVQDWDYDVFFQTGSVNYQESFRHEYSSLHVARSLDVVVDPATGRAVCRSFLQGTDPNCVPFNLWTLNSVTNQALAYLETPAMQRGLTTQSVIGATVTGDLGRYGLRFPRSNKSVEVALGFERRVEKLEFEVDSAFAAGLAGSDPIDNVKGSLEVKDVFAELRLPIFEWLNVNGTYRASNYGSKKTDTYGLGIRATPLKGVDVRGSLQRAVRAPDLNELHAPQLSVEGAYEVDPCSTGQPTKTFEQCRRTGVTAAQYGNIQDAPFGYPAIFGGNPDLAVETATTYTLGLVLTPYHNLSATIDWFDIRVENTIEAVDPATILDQCLQTGNSAYCDRVRRDPLTGTLFLNGATVNGIGQNIGTLRTAGIDVAVNYNRKLGNGHRLDLDFMGTYLTKSSFEPFVGAPAIQCAGIFWGDCGTPTPRWRHRVRTTWRTPWDLDMAATWRYTQGVKAQDPENIGATLPSGNYLDLAASWSIAKRWVLRGGINNVFDRDPPIIAMTNGSPSGNTFAQAYDALGRHVFVSVAAKF
jgi:iron complex outermembrane receptor protein